MRRTDDERMETLYKAAGRASRQAQPRQYQMAWEEIVLSGLFNSAEQDFAALATPALIRRMVRRIRRLEKRSVV